MVMTSGSGRLRLARDDSAPTSHVLAGALFVYLLEAANQAKISSCVGLWPDA